MSGIRHQAFDRRALLYFARLTYDLYQCGQIKKKWWKSTPNKEIYSIPKSDIFASSRSFCRDSQVATTQQ